MKIEYYHASKYGNGLRVAEEFQKQMALRDISVNVHHVSQAKPGEMPRADLYIMSSPGRFGKPIGEMKRFLKAIHLPAGTKYALLVTELRPVVNGKEPEALDGEPGKCQRVIPAMDEALQKKGLTKVADGKVFVTGIKGPLENGWRDKVVSYCSLIAANSELKS